jgi:hypothetical protein
MTEMKTKQESDKDALAEARKEMAKPPAARSARDYPALPDVTEDGKDKFSPVGD